jgi:hypothetical protein
MNRRFLAVLGTVVFCGLLLAGAGWSADNGTVTVNGLVWLKNPASCLGQMTWSQAISGVSGFASGGCPNLNDGSKAGQWRLPTKDELIQLQPKISALGNVRSDYHWSSTEAYGTSAYIVHMGNGAVSTFPKTAQEYTMPVRQP